MLPVAAAWLASCAAHAATPVAPGQRELLGWVEYVEFEQPRVRLKAKLDTGATTSSLNAMNLRRFRRGGQSWVRFEVMDPEDRDRRIGIEAPVVRTARIRRHDGQVQQRPVVYLGMCLGRVYQEQQFTLIDRSDFNYQVLVGRNFLRGHIVVDSEERFLSRPGCDWPATPSSGRVPGRSPP